MPPRLAPIHGRYPREMAIIGRLLVDYSELEIDLMHCVSMVRREYLDSTLKAMFRVRGETQRINIADALGRQKYKELGREAEFSEAISALRHCLKIRNKFAHSYWHDPIGTDLCYVSLEDLAESNDLIIDLSRLDFFFLDVPLLERHEGFYRYTEDVLTHVNHEAQTNARGDGTNPFPMPARLERPPLYTRKQDNTLR